MKFSDIKSFTRSANYTVDIPWGDIEDFLQRQEKFGLEINPEFQRGHVWSEAQQIAFVEFCLRGGKSSQDIYFNCKGWMRNFDGPMQLVDGLQRLTAVRRFLNDELPILGGHTRSDFEDDMPWMIASFKFHINDLPTYAEVLQWYLDLNTGGVVHTTDEIERVRELLRKAQA